MVSAPSFLLVALSSVLWAQSEVPGKLPRFEDYPAPVEHIRKPAAVRLSSADVRSYATQLRRASHRRPDFAGHYILAIWGCGAPCIMAAAIDAKTGTVTPLPFTVSDWPLDRNDPLTYKPNSRLLIVQGSRNEKGSGTYGYEFTGHSFRLLTSEPPPH